jgi:hypothetical protein
MSLARWLEFQISPLDWACLEGDDPTCDEAYIEWSYWTQGEYLDPRTTPQPGRWLSSVKIRGVGGRAMPHQARSAQRHSHIAYCGLCCEYANRRKTGQAKAPGRRYPASTGANINCTSLAAQRG